MFSMTLPMFIFTHQTSPGFTGQLGVKAFLHPFDALIINIGKAQQIGSHVARRVEPSRFIAQVDARQMAVYQSTLPARD